MVPRLREMGDLGAEVTVRAEGEGRCPMSEPTTQDEGRVMRRLLFRYSTVNGGGRVVYWGWRGTWNKTLIALVENYRAARRRRTSRVEAVRFAVQVARMVYRSSRI